MFPFDDVIMASRNSSQVTLGFYSFSDKTCYLRFREVSKPRNCVLKLLPRSEIWEKMMILNFIDLRLREILRKKNIHPFLHLVNIDSEA